jgi:hypothetical protein
MGTSEGGNLMKRTSTIALVLALALTAPLTAQPIAKPHPTHRSSWASLWNGFIHAIGNPFRLFDDPAPDGGTHTIPIIAPTPAPGSGS